MTQAVWRLILNGKTSGDEAVREAVMAMREQGQALQVRVTWEAGDAERLVHEAIAERVAVIIAGGGDGTLSEVAAAMAMSGQDADAVPRWRCCRWVPPMTLPLPPALPSSRKQRCA